MGELDNRPLEAAFFERRDFTSIKATQNRIDNLALKKQDQKRRAAPRKILFGFVLLAVLTPLVFRAVYHEFDMIRTAPPAVLIIVGSVGMLTAIWLRALKSLHSAFNDFLKIPMRGRQRRTKKRGSQNTIDTRFQVGLILTLIGLCIFWSWIAIGAVFSLGVWSLAAISGLWVLVVFRRLTYLLRTPRKIEDFLR